MMLQAGTVRKRRAVLHIVCVWGGGVARRKDGRGKKRRDGVTSAVKMEQIPAVKLLEPVNYKTINQNVTSN